MDGECLDGLDGLDGLGILDIENFAPNTFTAYAFETPSSPRDLQSSIPLPNILDEPCFVKEEPKHVHEQPAVITDMKTTPTAGYLIPIEQPASDCVDGNKRRRRLRNERQQELNRLAQQRYRQRKKEKYSDLQEAVDMLKAKIDELAILEAKHQALQQQHVELGSRVAVKDSELQDVSAKYTQCKQQLQLHGQTISQQNVRIKHQEQLILQQQQQLREQSQRNQALEERLKGITSSKLLHEQLSKVIQENIQGANAHQLTDVLVQHISTALSVCCRELYQSSLPSASADAHAVPVPCC